MVAHSLALINRVASVPRDGTLPARTASFNEFVKNGGGGFNDLRRPRRSFRRVVRASEGTEDGDSKPAAPPKKSEIFMSEDILARLKTAEEEAAKLREELAAVQAGGKPIDDEVAKKTDAEDQPRESLFTLSAERKNWLSETDVEFLIGDGPAEGGGQGLSEEEEAIVQRRLLLGVGASVILGGLALLPSDLFNSKPDQPLQAYVVPILRTVDLLNECDGLVENGEFQEVVLVLDRITGPPNNVKQNLEGAVRSMDTKEKREEGSKLAKDIFEYLEQIDAGKYFKDLGTVGRQGGAKALQYSQFSAQALAACKSSLKKFLGLLPRGEVESARRAILAVYE
ncbi:hypothetical protein BSKO_05995 [Bryopsis sp. KO-2023]|nr:hypothetical protein BSKO_05995 [Bryopsis sp. KO-2023]